VDSVSVVSDFNATIIDEFRANEGKVGGYFEGAPMVLLTTTGAKTGQVRTNPLVYVADGDRFIVIASKGGAPTNPDWYHNLVANPEASVEIGTDHFEVTATVLTGDERDRAWDAIVAERPGFAEYQTKTDRKIPAVALTRKA